MEESTWIDDNGNERGDSIDLSPAAYLLDSVREVDWEAYFSDNIEMQVYSEEDLK